MPCNDFSQNTTHVEFLGDFNKQFGFTALHSPSNSIIVTFRGSRNFDNWLHDLLFAKPDAPFPTAPKNAKIHFGFLSSYYQVRSEFLTRLKQLRQAYPDSTVRFLGHSLGGAIALIALLDALSQKLILVNATTLLSIGAPRVGNAEFAQWAHQQFPNALRIVNQNDLCPHLPPVVANFAHSGTEIFIENDAGDTFKCLTTTELESPLCSNQYKMHDISKHGYAWDYRCGIQSCKNYILK